MNDKNKNILKQVGKAVGISTAAGAGIGATGALINKKLKKKKEEKTAFDVVNEVFEKIAK